MKLRILPKLDPQIFDEFPPKTNYIFFLGIMYKQ
jgi:hypothetical protein